MKKNKLRKITDRTNVEKTPVMKVLDVLIVLAGIFMAICVIVMIHSFREEREYTYKKYSFSDAVSQQKYNRLLEMTLTNRMLGKGIHDPAYEEYYAVADYFEAEFYCQMYQNGEKQEEALAWEQKKKEAESRMGIYIAEKENITRMLQNGRAD